MATVTADSAAPAGETAPPLSGAATSARWAGPSAAAGVLLLLVADLPRWSSGVWAPKMAVLLVMGAAGLPLLVARAAGRDRWPDRLATRPAALAAVAFVVVAAASAAASPAGIAAAVGLYGQGTGLVFVACLAGMWALGTATHGDAVWAGRSGRAWVELAVVAGAVVNAAVGIGQEVFHLTGLVPGDKSFATGLLGNPAYLGAACAAGLALLGGRATAQPWRWLGPVVLLGLAIGASGERLSALSALAIAVLEVGCAAAGRRRHRDASPVLGRAAGFGTAIVFSVVVGSLLPAMRTHGSAGVLGRAAHSTVANTVTGRVDAWRAGLAALGHRPLLGSGPGQFRDAIAATLTPHQARSVDLSIFVGAHDLVVEYATTTGVLGLVAVVAWLVLAARRRRGRLVIAAGALLLCALSQPMEAATTPLLFLLLGAARLAPAPVADAAAVERRGPARLRSPGRWLVVVTAAAAAVAVVAGGALVVGDHSYARAEHALASHRPVQAAAAARAADGALFAWPEPASLLARADAAAGHRQAALRADDVARSRDPADPALWVACAEAALSAGRPGVARTDVRQALRLEPTDGAAAMLLAGLAHGRAVGAVR